MLRDRLNQYLNNGVQQDTTYQIAEYIICNIEHLDEISIYRISKDCHVSVATVSRFCKKFGFEDFYSFKDACELESEIINLRCDTHPVDKSLMKNGVKDICKDLKYLELQMGNSLKKLSYEKLNQLVQDIINYPHVYFLGFSNSFIFYGHLQCEFLNMNKYCHTLTELDEQNLPTYSKDSLIVIFSMHGILRKKAPAMMELAKNRFAKSWEVSQVYSNNILDDTIYFGKCETSTADYMTWIYIAETMVYKYKEMNKKVTDNATNNS